MLWNTTNSSSPSPPLIVVGYTDAVGQPTASDLERCEHIFGPNAADQHTFRVLGPLRTEHLANLGTVVAETQVDARGREQVVQYDVIVAGKRTHAHRLEISVVESLDIAAAVIDQRDKRRVGKRRCQYRVWLVMGR